MKISIQLILAAIIVILLLLMGAYALTNGNNTSTHTATETPTATITPTETTVVSPSATPSMAVTATPAPATTPTPTAAPNVTAASGVKLTKYGYWITYPPFSYYDIHQNPYYVTSDTRPVVQFTYTSGSTLGFQFNDGSDISYIRGDDDFHISIPLTRSNTSGRLSPQITITGTNLPSDDLYIETQPVFNDGQATATLSIVYIHAEVDDPYGTFSISTSSDYVVGANNPFNMYLNMMW